MDQLLSAVQRTYAGLLCGMDAVSVQRHPFNDPEHWSAQQIVEHLILTYGSTITLLRTRLAKGRPTKVPVTLYQRVAQILVLRVGWYPRGMKAPAPVCPPCDLAPLSGPELASRMQQELEHMDSLLEECFHQFGRQRVASHFALGPMTVSQWRSFHAFHARHHEKQLARIASNFCVFSEKTASTT